MIKLSNPLDFLNQENDVWNIFNGLRISKTKSAKWVREKISDFQENGKKWLSKRGYSPSRIKYIEEKFDDINDITMGNRSLDSIYVEKGNNYINKILAPELRKKNIIISQDRSGRFVVIQLDPKTLEMKQIIVKNNTESKDIISDKNTSPKQDKEFENPEKKILGSIGNDFDEVLKGNKKLSDFEKEKGADYIIELSGEARKKGLTLEKKTNGDWVIYEINKKTGKNVPVQIQSKNNIDSPFQSTEESNYIKKITEGKMTWDELEKAKGRQYVENLVRGKDAGDIWTNAKKNPDLTIGESDKKKYNNDKEIVIMRKWDEAKERLDKNKPKIEGRNDNLGTQKPYSPRDVRDDLIEHHGTGNVKSTTVPPLSMPNVKLAGQEKVIEVQRTREVFDHKTNKMVTESVTEKVTIVFDKRGFPIFDDVAKVETRIPIEDFRKLKYEDQMKAATLELKKKLKSGELNKNQFTPDELTDIYNEKYKVGKLTWHHHQETGRMQLVPTNIHEEVKHIGWKKMSEGK